MNTSSSVELSRDCEAVQIPSGAPAVLPKGAAVDITQTLGGTFTVMAQGGLFRISSKDADALGLDPSAVNPTDDKPADVALDEKTIWELLKTCYDPEIPGGILETGVDRGAYPQPRTFAVGLDIKF